MQGIILAGHDMCRLAERICMTSMLIENALQTSSHTTGILSYPRPQVRLPDISWNTLHRGQVGFRLWICLGNNWLPLLLPASLLPSCHCCEHRIVTSLIKFAL